MPPQLREAILTKSCFLMDIVQKWQKQPKNYIKLSPNYPKTTPPLLEKVQTLPHPLSSIITKRRPKYYQKTFRFGLDHPSPPSSFGRCPKGSRFFLKMASLSFRNFQFPLLIAGSKFNQKAPFSRRRKKVKTKYGIYFVNDKNKPGYFRKKDFKLTLNRSGFFKY